MCHVGFFCLSLSLFVCLCFFVALSLSRPDISLFYFISSSSSFSSFSSFLPAFHFFLLLFIFLPFAPFFSFSFAYSCLPHLLILWFSLFFTIFPCLSLLFSHINIFHYSSLYHTFSFIYLYLLIFPSIPLAYPLTFLSLTPILDYLLPYSYFLSFLFFNVPFLSSTFKCLPYRLFPLSFFNHSFCFFFFFSYSSFFHSPSFITPVIPSTFTYYLSSYSPHLSPSTAPSGPRSVPLIGLTDS